MTSIDKRQTSAGAFAAARRADGWFPLSVPLFALCCGIGLAALTYLERISGGSLFLACSCSCCLERRHSSCQP